MKKYLIVLMTFLLCLLFPISVSASQVDIEIEVPTQHSVSIRAEHASAIYLDDEEEGEGDVYPVPRFSNPKFRLQADENWQIEQVFVNDVNVTKQVEDGVLKLTRVSSDQVITIETKMVQSPSDSQNQSVNTGDDNNKWIWVILVLLGAGIVVIAKYVQKRSAHHKK